MEHIFIPHKRAHLLKGKTAQDLEKRLKCRLRVEQENEVMIDGDPYDEYNAKNVIQAFGRGFEIKDACKLLSESYFFKDIDLKHVLGKGNQMRNIKARIIGEGGKAKEYIVSVSGASLAIFGNSVSIIGTIEEINIATTAIQVLVEGGTHKKAYRLMESARRRLKYG